jgi:hypothetical protein
VIQKQGLVAVLDALGAATYSEKQIEQFSRSRQTVLELLATNAEIKALHGSIQPNQVTTFTFNDTVLIVYGTNGIPTLEDVRHFATLLRRFEVDSLLNGILFRGSFSTGRFQVDDETNTVMGAAVTDAAAWYDSAEWVGINATPFASLFVQSLIDQTGADLTHLLVDWDVPMKDRGSRTLKALNWPKVFVAPRITPCRPGENHRAKCANLLTVHGVPKGTEQKYSNSMVFYDHCVALREAAVAKSSGKQEKKVAVSQARQTITVKPKFITIKKKRKKTR